MSQASLSYSITKIPPIHLPVYQHFGRSLPWLYLFLLLGQIIGSVYIPQWATGHFSASSAAGPLRPSAGVPCGLQGKMTEIKF